MERVLGHQTSSCSLPLTLRLSPSRPSPSSSTSVSVATSSCLQQLQQARCSFPGFDRSSASPPSLPQYQHGFPSLLPFDSPKFGLAPVAASADRPREPSSSAHFWEVNNHDEVNKALVHIRKDTANSSPDSFETLSEDMAMGLVLRAASGTGWTTGSGLEGPSNAFELNQGQFSEEIDEQQRPLLSKSPRRRMRVAFTCNVCGARTTRAINPHAYTDGTVFVQCGGCNIFHKLVDNLKLFHELRGSIFPSGVYYGETDFFGHQPYDFLGLDDFHSS